MEKSNRPSEKTGKVELVRKLGKLTLMLADAQDVSLGSEGSTSPETEEEPSSGLLSHHRNFQKKFLELPEQRSL